MSFTKEYVTAPKQLPRRSAPIAAESSLGAYVLRVATRQFEVIKWHTSSGILLGAPARGGDYDELSLSEGAYEMANLQPEETGLPFVVWISPKGGARHGARVKVSDVPTTSESKASVSIPAPVEVKAGKLSKDELDVLTKWIDLNREALMDFWDGRIQYTSQILNALERLK